MAGINKKRIMILAVLMCTLCCTMTAFAFNPFSSGREIVSQDKQEEIELVIYRNHPEDSTPFQMKNMFPGDLETKQYLLTIAYRGMVTVHFQADICAGYEKLAEVLKCKVVLNETNEVLYDGFMRDMPDKISHRLYSDKNVVDELSYEITVSLDTSVGNEYMNQELYADFRWWAEVHNDPGDDDESEDAESRPTEDETNESNQTEDETTGSIETDDDELDDSEDIALKPDDDDEGIDVLGSVEEIETEEVVELLLPGELAVLPMTGDINIAAIIAVAAGCMFFLVILLYRRRKEDEEHGQ